MRRIALSILGVGAWVLFGSFVWAKETIYIAILPFENKTEVKEVDVAGRMKSLIESGLVSLRRFNIIEREKLEQLMKEQGLSLSGFVEGKVEPGKIKGVDALLMGEITNITVVPEAEQIFYTVTIKVKVEAQVKLIDLETGEVKLSEIQDGFEKNTLATGTFQTFPSEVEIEQEAKALIEKATKECADKILARVASVYPLEGKVLKVEGKKLWVSLGRQHGVSPKQKLLLIALGEVLKDPETGEVISATKEVIGEVEIKRVDEKFSEAEIKRLEKGKSVKIGDRVVTQ